MNYTQYMNSKSVKDIQKKFNISRRTLKRWTRQFNWKTPYNIEEVEDDLRTNHTILWRKYIFNNKEIRK